ncbi:PilZ domain-containing protein [Nitrincola tibetensis]|uniref:PilZ domain-containing protein n=1 Tax=Nitrincola tibetensis TaxID=2219697 RepID=UPI001EFD27DA|nr:PilZ domain-containing protein [Nitrincola tibetensis]
MSKIINDRRRFTRIHFDAECEVHFTGKAAVMQLVDISFRGALLTCNDTLDLSLDEPAELCIYLANDILIKMQVSLSTREHPHYGFVIEEIDIDSMSHLRRLVELNLGDETLLERELEQMILDEPQI